MIDHDEAVQIAETELADANESGDPERVQRAETALSDAYEARDAAYRGPSHSLYIDRGSDRVSLLLSLCRELEGIVYRLTAAS